MRRWLSPPLHLRYKAKLLIAICLVCHRVQNPRCHVPSTWHGLRAEQLMYANIHCTLAPAHPSTIDYLIPLMSQANAYRNWAKKLCGCEIGLKRRLLVTGMI